MRCLWLVHRSGQPNKDNGGGINIAKDKKAIKKEKPTVKEDSDDNIDLQSLISSLKAQSSEKSKEKTADIEPTKTDEASDEKAEASFELVEEEKDTSETEDKSSALESISKLEGKSKSKGVSDEERKAFEEEKAKFEEQRRQLEEEKRALEDELRSHKENRSKTEEDLKAVGTELLRKKDSIAKLEEQLKKKDVDQREKEKAIKKATDLLLSQRQSMADKETKLESLRVDLTKKAEELKQREDSLATAKDKTKELDIREIRIRELEAKLNERELHHKAMEVEMASCPRCSSKDRFLSVERMIEELKEFGLTDEQAETDLKEMRALVDAGSNEKAIELGDKVIRRLKDLKDNVLSKGIIYMLTSTEKHFKHAKDVGGHGDRIADAERWLVEARQLIAKEEYKTAEHYIKEADFLLQSVARGVTTAGPGAEAPATAPPEAVQRNYTCPSCNTTFTIDTMERPVRITCPGCQIELLIKEDITFA